MCLASGRACSRVRPNRVRADKAYASRKNRAYLRSRGIRCTIPDKADQARNRKKRGSRDEPRCRLRSAVEMTEQPLGRARRVRTKPRRDIDRQDQAPAVEARQRQPDQYSPQPIDADPALVQAAVQRSMPTTMLGQQRQVHRDFTAPSAHNIASANSNNSSRRAVRHS